MSDHEVRDAEALVRAKEIAQRTLGGEHDLLLACRDLADLRARLPQLPADLLDTFVAISSEVDDLPIGCEREYWEANALAEKDREADDYRRMVAERVMEALRQLLLLD
jgi:hypothetical protein